MLNPNTQTQDFRSADPSFLAAAGGLGTVLLLFYMLQAPESSSAFFSNLDLYADAHVALLSAATFALALNGVAIYSFVSRVLGLNQQGKRLAQLAGKKSKLHLPSRLVLIGAGTWAAAVYAILTTLSVPDSNDLATLVSLPALRDGFALALRLNFAVAAFMIALTASRFAPFERLRRHFGQPLPEFPKTKDSIVLGSVGDDDPSATPSWVTLNKRALNGNVLITGSIGGGKTQGTILPYLDQVLANFTIRPSILAIDPKGTFIPEALKIIDKHGMSEHVLHLKLGGDVTFNPIFTPKPLRGAEFLDVAHMLRSASINYMGKSVDSPFWEVSAFNLLKSCLVATAAHFYDSESELSDYGLTDLYETMVEASKETIRTAEKLDNLSKVRSFTPEERFNIERAARYFQEYALLEAKVKTGILATATAFLNQFQEFQASQIFCPKHKNAIIKSMDDVVDSGKILLFDIANPALARSMGTLIKLHFQQSVLKRLQSPHRSLARTAILIADEFQDIVSTGGGTTLGDERFCAKNREANGVALVATQSLTSLKSSIGREDAARELIQNFRTVISGHSSDLATINNFKELVGQEDQERTSHAVSESVRNASRNLILGGFEAPHANLSESLSTSQQKGYTVTGKEFSRLKTFETFALIYDGIQTNFQKLFLKPHFLPKKNLLQSQILKGLAPCLLLTLSGACGLPTAHAFPNVCSVVKTSEFRSCLDFSVGACVCGWPTPRPCAEMSYYVPRTFIEVFPNARSTYFGSMPGVAAQLASLTHGPQPFGAESDDDTQSSQAHTLAVPMVGLPYSSLPCGPESTTDRLCLESMSEHTGSTWNTGEADQFQPKMLGWSLSPKGCLAAAAASSLLGGQLEASLSTPASGGCSVPMDWLPKYPPSNHPACTGWGVFYPRSGVYNGGSQTAGALMVASRMKSLATEIFKNTSSSLDEKWQMISPQSSSCFREGQNIGILETIKNVRELGRITSGKLSGYLFTVWSKVSCCKELAQVPAAYAAIEVMNLACQGLGGSL